MAGRYWRYYPCKRTPPKTTKIGPQSASFRGGLYLPNGINESYFPTAHVENVMRDEQPFRMQNKCTSMQWAARLRESGVPCL
jgi:hypothetical protein